MSERRELLTQQSQTKSAARQPRQQKQAEWAGRLRQLVSTRRCRFVLKRRLLRRRLCLRLQLRFLLLHVRRYRGIG